MHGWIEMRMRYYSIAACAVSAAMCLAAGAIPPPGAALPNPERGFRFEKKIALEPGDRNFMAWPLTDVEMRYKKEDGVVMAQAYCYLTRYCDSEIPQSKLDALQVAFDEARAQGVKLILRFAYENTIGKLPEVKGATTERILSHIVELTPIVRRNIDVIYTLQIGWVGAWGEFHSSVHGINKDPVAVAKIVKATLDMLPESRCTMMRSMYKRADAIAALKTGGDRIGFFDDALLSNTSEGGTWRMAWKNSADCHARPGNPMFDEVCRIGVHVPIEGELFWRSANVDLDAQGGLQALVRFWRNHFTTFSVVHGNSELDALGGKSEFGAVDLWKLTPVTPDLLAVFSVPADPEYFEGVPHRTAYDYIRDHLGYRIKAKSCVRDGADVTLVLRNCGFAAPINPRQAYFVVTGTDGNAVEIPTGFDCRSLEPDKDVSVRAAVPRLKADDRLALWLPDECESIRRRPEYAIMLAGGAEIVERDGRLLNVLDFKEQGDTPSVCAETVPFSAIRLRKPHTDSDEVWQATLKQFSRHRAGVDEVWFSTGICFPKMDEHRANAQRLATASEDLRRIGILPSLQIQSTIGHGDVFTRYADNSGIVWQTYVSSDGTAADSLNCPRAPGFIVYMREMASTYADAMRPYAVWIDDDIRIVNHHGGDNQANSGWGCHCDGCVGAFAAKENSVGTRPARFHGAF